MFEQVQQHDHAVFVYDDAAALQSALAAFVAEGVAADALIVFVHAFEGEGDVHRFLDEAGIEYRPLLERQLFLVSFYREAFEGDARRIDFNHVVSVIDQIIADAKARGRSGVRTMVDASRAYLTTGREDEWFTFEARLGRRLQNAVALVCAYDRATIDTPRRYEQVLTTHLFRFGP